MKTMLALAGLALAAGASAPAKTLRDAPPRATPAGKALSCIPIASIRETRVHGDGVIDFHLSGRKVYRNTLPHACSGLGFEERFSYSTSLSQLCSSDIITVLRSPPSIGGPSCGLGRFQPVTLEKKRR